MPKENPDLELARGVIAGRREAFEQLFTIYFPRLYRFALVRTRYDEDLAEEVAQATLCKGLDKLRGYRGEASLFTWLCTLCRHELGLHYARSQRAASLEQIEEMPALRAALESLEADGASPEQQAARDQIARCVRATLDFLPARYAQVLEWKYTHGESVRQIGLRLTLSDKAVESLLTRARAAFRDGFAAYARSCPSDHYA
jgi:RNA polymerase sigma-70 factor, ECF subfamily